jgi:hypothetical protein
MSLNLVLGLRLGNDNLSCRVWGLGQIVAKPSQFIYNMSEIIFKTCFDY